MPEDLPATAPSLEPDPPPQEVPPVHDSTAHWLAWIVVLGFFFVLAALVFREIPEKSRDIFNILSGVLGGAVTTILGYYFGSSAMDDTMRLRRRPERPGSPAVVPPPDEGTVVVTSSSSS